MSHICIIFTTPDGSVRINHPVPALRQADESAEAFGARMAADAQAKDPSLAGLPWIIADSDALPRDRQRRHAWRLRGQRVEDDPAIADRPDHQAEMMAAIQQARTIEELKAMLLQHLGRRRDT